jgi:hypothetical protein
MFKRICESAGIGEEWTPREVAPYLRLDHERQRRADREGRSARRSPQQPEGRTACRHQIRPVIPAGRGQPRQARHRARGILRRPANTITPPSTVFAAFNHHAGPKEIAVYPFSVHEGGGTRHCLAQVAFLRQAGVS